MSSEEFWHSMTEWLRWEGTSGDCLLQAPALIQITDDTKLEVLGTLDGCQQEQAAQDFVWFWISSWIKTAQLFWANVYTSSLLKNKRAFLTFKWIFFNISLCQLPIFLTLWITMEIHPFQVFTHKDLPEPSHLWAEQSQLSQPLLLCQMLQILNHLCGILLDSLQCAHLHKGTQIWTQIRTQSHLIRANWRERVTSLHVLAVLFPMHSRTLLPFFASGAKLMPTWCLPRLLGPFLPGYFTIVLLQPGTSAWAEPDISLSWAPGGSCYSFLWSVYVPVDSSATIRHISHSFHFCHLAESMLCLIIQVINEDMNYLSDISAGGLVSGIQYSDWALDELIGSLITKYWARQFNQFLPYLILPHPSFSSLHNPYFLHFLWRCKGKQYGNEKKLMERLLPSSSSINVLSVSSP